MTENQVLFPDQPTDPLHGPSAEVTDSKPEHVTVHHHKGQPRAECVSVYAAVCRLERTSSFSQLSVLESRDSAADVTTARAIKSKPRAVLLNQSEAVVEAHTRQQTRVSAPCKHVFVQRAGGYDRTEQNPCRPNRPDFLLTLCSHSRSVWTETYSCRADLERVYPSVWSRSSSSLRFRPSHERNMGLSPVATGLR